jgi:quinoprotein glucose dehydrogenase
MTFRMALAAILLMNGLGAQAGRTARDGVYTEKQAVRGKEEYAKSCASCHAPDLRGGSSTGEEAPPLAGDEFVKGWERFTLGDLFERIKTTMPDDAPGTLSDQQTADILAFMLATSKFPSGPSELSSDKGALSTVTLSSPMPK